MRLSFWLAMIFGLLLGRGIDIYFSITTTLVDKMGLPYPFATRILFAVCVAAVWLLWVAYNTPTNHKTGLLLFNTFRWRVGPGGKGFFEGLNGRPLGWPVFWTFDKDVSESTETFMQEKAYSKDRQPLVIAGTFNRFVDDVYATFNVANMDEAIQALTSMVLKWVRGGAEAYSAADLVSQEANGADSSTEPSKIILARKAYENVQRELASGIASWGLNIRPTLQIDKIDINPSFESALMAVERENVEGESERIQTERRAQQLKILTDKGVNPDLAAGMVLVDAGKTGATVNTVNFPGAQGVGEAAGSFGKAAAEWLKRQGPQAGGTT